MNVFPVDFLCVEVYIDDILVHGKSREEHDLRLRATFYQLQKHGFRLQESKLLLGQESVPAFGYILSAKGIEPDPENVRAIVEAPAPTTVAELQGFLGSINFFQDFLQDAASITEPLRTLTRKETPFEWGPSQETAFRTLKAMLVQRTQLQTFDPEAETILTTDASDVGIGALLSQKISPRDPEAPIAFFNKTLSPAERNYSATEKEALACIMAMEHWEQYLYGRPFTLRTDHQALETILKGEGQNKRQTSKFVRWKERLDPFNFQAQYLPGPLNPVADYLSRLTQKAKELNVEIGSITLKSIKEARDEDPQLLKVMQMKTQQTPRSQLKKMEQSAYTEARVWDQLSVEDGLLYREDKIVAPAPIRKDILQNAHLGHPGIVRMKSMVREHYWWPGATAQIERYVRDCTECQRSTKSRNRQVIPETSIPRPEQPGQQWGVDITGPFFNEGRYIVAAIDYTTRYPEILATKDISSQAIIKWLETLWDRYGTPTALVTDNGTQFTSREFQEYLRQKDIHQYTTPVYHPQQNGLVEVFNRTLKHGIQAFGKVSWEKGLRNLIRSYRLAPNDEGKSPFELMFGRKFRPDWVPNTTKPVRRLAQTKMDHANQESPGQEKMWTSWSLFHKGQLVYKKIPWVLKGTSPWKGPCSIVKVMGSYTFLLDDGQIWHARNLKRAATSLPEPEQWVGDQIPPPQSPLRRSTRSTRGRPLKRLNM